VAAPPRRDRPDVRVVFSARYRIDIGPHVFPTEKYALLHARLIDTGVIDPADVVQPEAASRDDLRLVHTTEYLDHLQSGTLPAAQLAELELPWSHEMVEGFRIMVGGTIRAATIACGFDSVTAGARPIAAHLGGGLHHAFPNHGEGFCPFNDVAVATRVLQLRGLDRIAIVDLDVHQGNGTAFVFEADPRVFTFSMHQQHNYPLWKPRGSLDIGLPDGTGDRAYLDALGGALPTVEAHAPACVFYLAGADPYEGDRLGGLRLTREGLRMRDRMVIEMAARAGVPLVITLAGGYAARVDDTVAIHATTIEEAARAWAA
jgi:acetoin utilization deacetylase AcuC-like enzyme